MDDMTPTPAPDNPARAAATAEYRAVMTDPAHPVHAAYTRGQMAVVDQHLKPFYDKAAAGAPPVAVEQSVSLGPVDPHPGETPDEAEVRQRNEVILAPLKEAWGPDYDRRFAAALVGVRTVFEGQGEMLDHLGERIRMTYGPKGEAAVLKLFAELEDIKRS